MFEQRYFTSKATKALRKKLVEQGLLDKGIYAPDSKQHGHGARRDNSSMDPFYDRSLETASPHNIINKRVADRTDSNKRPRKFY